MDKRVFVHRNEAGSDGKILCVEPKDSLAKFKRAASKKLGLKVRYITPPNVQEGSMITLCASRSKQREYFWPPGLRLRKCLSFKTMTFCTFQRERCSSKMQVTFVFLFSHSHRPIDRVALLHWQVWTKPTKSCKCRS